MRCASMDGVHDVVAIGCGPFNLGLAALASTVEGLDLVVFDARSELRWHPGLMFEDASFQLSFLADLVTLVDPTHPLSFLAYLRDVDRMYPFFIREQFHPTRREYEAYLRWAVSKLDSVRFSHAVESVMWNEEQQCFSVQVARANGGRIRVHARDLVIGIGTEPFVPEALAGIPRTKLLHSAEYLHRRRDVERAQHVTVVGSGQSAAEIVLDLLRQDPDEAPPFSWLTRARSFAPLDYTKLVLEMTTPEYVQYFHGLPEDVRDRLNLEQWHHYRGISSDTIEQIHGLLYHREIDRRGAAVELRCGVAIESCALLGSGSLALACRNRDTGAAFEHATSLVIAATGYRERRPSFLAAVEPLLRRDGQGRYRVSLDHSIELEPSVNGRIFVANAGLHSHGVASPDLGVSAHRNATILNAITGREVYRLPRRTAFTSFALPPPPHAAGSAPRPQAGARDEASPRLAVPNTRSTEALAGG